MISLTTIGSIKYLDLETQWTAPYAHRIFEKVCFRKNHANNRIWLTASDLCSNKLNVTSRSWHQIKQHYDANRQKLWTLLHMYSLYKASSVECVIIQIVHTLIVLVSSLSLQPTTVSGAVLVVTYEWDKYSQTRQGTRDKIYMGLTMIGIMTFLSTFEAEHII